MTLRKLTILKKSYGNIHLYEDFVSQEDVQIFLSIFKNELSKFLPYESSKTGSRILTFGQDNFHYAPLFENPNILSKTIPNYEIFLKKYFKKLENLAEVELQTPMCLSVLWFIELFRGGLDAHVDNVEGAIYEYNHVYILYLNEPEGGEIVFPDQNFKFTPKSGSLISFPAEYSHEILPVASPRYSIPSWLTTDKKYSIYNY